MYIVLFATIASVTKLQETSIQAKPIQENPKTKVDSVLQMATVYEKKIDKDIMQKISNSNSKIDSLENVIKRQKYQIRRYKKLLKKR